ncbi:TPA: DUF2170 family protein [Candidatus Poribacteria bacterium]|nr:DUF2170 family protein [Candidatus Poribacteria bacterium]
MFRSPEEGTKMTHLNTKESILRFLEEHGYDVQQSEEDILVVKDEDGIPLYLMVGDEQVEFMLDLCGVDELDPERREEAYEKILDENTEILPTCFGIDSTNPQDKRIVLVDSLALENLDPNEMLLSLDSIYMNVLTAHKLLSPYFKEKRRD